MSVKALESLAATAQDSVRGYELAAEKATAAELKQVLREQAQKRRGTVNELNAEITRLGGTPQTDGTATGKLHQLWTGIADMIGDKNEAAAERVEEGEDYIEKKFREAIDNGGWEAETLAVLRKAHGEISEGERLTDRLEDKYD
jgi:uncharacterized protein (TIGR02284 family)